MIDNYFNNPWTALLPLTIILTFLSITNNVVITYTKKAIPKYQHTIMPSLGITAIICQRILLILVLFFFVTLDKPFYKINTSWISTNLSLQTLILIIAGALLFIMSIKDIIQKFIIENKKTTVLVLKRKQSVKTVLVKLLSSDFVFSLATAIIALGMTNGLGNKPSYSIIISIIAIVFSILLAHLISAKFSFYTTKVYVIQILIYAFLLLIGFLLIMDAAHLSQTTFLGNQISIIPKTYLYFFIMLTLFIELLVL